MIAEYFKVDVDSYTNASFVINGVSYDPLNVPEFKEGTEVTVNLTASSGYKIDKIIAQDGSGNEITSKEIGENDDTSITFALAKDTIIKADTSRIMITVNFYVDGELFKSESVPVNTTLILPTPVKDPTDTINYIFDKWEELEEGQTSVVVTESVDYHAHFIEYLLTNTDDAMQSSKKVMTTIAVASLCTIGAGFLFGLIFLIAKREKDDEDDVDKKTREKKYGKKN